MKTLVQTTKRFNGHSFVQTLSVQDKENKRAAATYKVECDSFLTAMELVSADYGVPMLDCEFKLLSTTQSTVRSKL